MHNLPCFEVPMGRIFIINRNVLHSRQAGNVLFRNYATRAKAKSPLPTLQAEAVLNTTGCGQRWMQPMSAAACLLCLLWNTVNQPRTSTQATAHKGSHNAAALPGRNTTWCQGCHQPPTLSPASISNAGEEKPEPGTPRDVAVWYLCSQPLAPRSARTISSTDLVPVPEHKWHWEREGEGSLQMNF